MNTNSNKIIENYLDNHHSDSMYVYSAHYMCTECFSSPISYYDSYCPFPNCSKGKMCANSEICNEKKCNVCLYSNHTSQESLVNCLNRKCRHVDHDLSRTKDVGRYFLRNIFERFDITDSNISASIDDIKNDSLYYSKLFDGFLSIANRYDGMSSLDEDDFLSLLSHYCSEYNRLKFLSRHKIKRIIFKNLFGYNSYELNFNIQNNISIIIGGNGFGKTTILNIIKTLLEDNYSGIEPMELLSDDLEFDSNFNLVQSYESLNKKIKYDLDLKRKITYLLSVPFDEILVELCTEEKNEDVLSFRILKDNMYDIATVYFNIGGFRPEIPVVLDSIDNCKTRNIALQKILDISRGIFLYPIVSLQDGLLSIMTQPSINKHSKFIYNNSSRIYDVDDIIDELDAYLQASSKCKDEQTESKLYSTIFNKIMKPDVVKELSLLVNFLRNEIDNLLMNKDKTIYDSKEKFNYINSHFHLQNANKILFGKQADTKLFLLLNKAYSFLKDIEIMSKYLYKFYPITDKGKKTVLLDYQSSDNFLFFKNSLNENISFEKLSSGEKNIIKIIYDLIFKADSGSIIIIDEPEISLHIEWQQKILSTIEDIIKEKQYENIQVILSTHSPFVLYGRNEFIVEKRIL